MTILTALEYALAQLRDDLDAHLGAGGTEADADEQREVIETLDEFRRALCAAGATDSTADVRAATRLEDHHGNR